MSETVDLLLRGAHLLDRDGPVDVAITGDRIASVGTVTGTATVSTPFRVWTL